MAHAVPAQQIMPFCGNAVLLGSAGLARFAHIVATVTTAGTDNGYDRLTIIADFSWQKECYVFSSNAGYNGC
jgi:hypothetical protein